ncbi:endonuclease III 2 [Striga asiatica]|uniref:Endonuclease III 2 n=1 Tax=Striga asiatica TaxID=4170 RepID=A0A5A7QN26_STRAF|nr:endonuclease III 2 [Striga asiatica]
MYILTIVSGALVIPKQVPQARRTRAFNSKVKKSEHTWEKKQTASIGFSPGNWLKGFRPRRKKPIDEEFRSVRGAAVNTSCSNSRFQDLLPSFSSSDTLVRVPLLFALPVGIPVGRSVRGGDNDILLRYQLLLVLIVSLFI